ncbi:hypothetical protein GOBAR_AA15512 [Gossypium barbadense]|uniref:Uncharacterized protein n=1 Tax=Gossypium barbadense TaxID=3634 RepID=A0A2P5XP60_GOSBA|nr:hypothetical protein GOBAR_AA15512 [Gossypium barbadense]
MRATCPPFPLPRRMAFVFPKGANALGSSPKNSPRGSLVGGSLSVRVRPPFERWGPFGWGLREAGRFRGLLWLVWDGNCRSLSCKKKGRRPGAVFKGAFCIPPVFPGDGFFVGFLTVGFSPFTREGGPWGGAPDFFRGEAAGWAFHTENFGHGRKKGSTQGGGGVCVDYPLRGVAYTHKGTACLKGSKAGRTCGRRNV